MDSNIVKEYVKSNPKKVKMRLSEKYPSLGVLRYAKSVFWNNEWDDVLELCRGTVVDEQYNVVSMPFKKIYNFGIESRAPVFSDDTEVTVFRKVNGFMANITYHQGEIVVSTTGSLDSPFVGYVKSFITPEIEEVVAKYPQHSFLFECVHPADPHIIPERTGLYLLALSLKEWDTKIEVDPVKLLQLANEMQCYSVESCRTTLKELKSMAKNALHEGFVAYTDDGQSFKIKSPYYLTKKFFARLTNTEKLLDRGVEHRIPEEYHPLLKTIRDRSTMFMKLNEQQRLDWMRVYIETNLGNYDSENSSV